jgi:hypothetical protein
MIILPLAPTRIGSGSVKTPYSVGQNEHDRNHHAVRVRHAFHFDDSQLYDN